MHIAFITLNYPTPARPTAGTFVQQFVRAFSRLGHQCTVVNPASWLHLKYGRLPPVKEMDAGAIGSSVLVKRPRYLSFSSRKIGNFHSAHWTQLAMNRVAAKAISQLRPKPDLVYGHFLYHAGAAATYVGRKLQVPSVVGVGEGTFWTVDAFGRERAKQDFRETTGFIAVATHIREGLIDQFGVNSNKILLAPNGVDLSRFVRRDRQEARAKLGLAPDRFLIVFVGAFDNLKGGIELTEATRGLDFIDVAMIGQGGVAFDSPNIIHKGRVAHDLIPTWLNAGDLFVLPTREEGSCNAIIEAMACGLPIVTSKGAYMDDLVDDQIALRVDPFSVSEIRSAILTLHAEPDRRTQLSQACVEKSKKFDINERVSRISKWFEELVQSQSISFLRG